MPSVEQKGLQFESPTAQSKRDVIQGIIECLKEQRAGILVPHGLLSPMEIETVLIDDLHLVVLHGCSRVFRHEGIVEPDSKSSQPSDTFDTPGSTYSNLHLEGSVRAPLLTQLLQSSGRTSFYIVPTKQRIHNENLKVLPTDTLWHLHTNGEVDEDVLDLDANIKPAKFDIQPGDRLFFNPAIAWHGAVSYETPRTATRQIYALAYGATLAAFADEL